MQSSVSGLKNMLHFSFRSAIFRTTWSRTIQPDDEIESTVPESEEEAREKYDIAWTSKRNGETSSPFHIFPDPSVGGPLKSH
jgi:hypothetical protein